MITSFKCKETEEIFNGGTSKHIPSAINKAGKRKLDMIHAAFMEKDLRVPPANRLESLKGDLEGYYSIRINDQYRIVFKFNAGNAQSVYITDYH